MGYFGALQVWTVVFLSLALYGVIELNIIILTTFKTRRGLYFWSFVVATNGIAPYSISIMLRNILRIGSPELYIALTAIGWVSMVTGQSLVLYSRLHLVVHRPLYLRLVLGMIIIDAFILHIPKIVTTYGSIKNPTPKWILASRTVDKIQTPGFFIQEFIISAIYIKSILTIYPWRECRQNKASRKMRRHLLLVNTAVVLLDIVIVVIGLLQFWGVITAFRAFIYSVKLKVEFSVLNRLMELTQRGISDDINISSISRHGSIPGVAFVNFDGMVQNQGPRHGPNDS